MAKESLAVVVLLFLSERNRAGKKTLKAQLAGFGTRRAGGCAGNKIELNQVKSQVKPGLTFEVSLIIFYLSETTFLSYQTPCYPNQFSTG